MTNHNENELDKDQMWIDAELLESLSARAKELEPHSYALMCATNSRLIVTEKAVVSLFYRVELLEKLVGLEKLVKRETAV